MSDIVLRAKDLGFSYERRKVLRSVQVSLHSGEILWVTGANGAGKTTLVKLLAGLLPTDEGELKWPTGGGVSYLAAESNGLLTELPAENYLSLMTGVRCRERLQAVLLSSGLKKATLEVGLPLHSYSTGMKRRVAFSRLVLEQRSLWVLDEPVSGLDTRGIKYFSTICGQQIQRGGAIVVVSHDRRALAELEYKELAL